LIEFLRTDDGGSLSVSLTSRRRQRPVQAFGDDAEHDPLFVGDEEEIDILGE
jgi:hypothetical protein